MPNVTVANVSSHIFALVCATTVVWCAQVGRAEEGIQSQDLRSPTAQSAGQQFTQLSSAETGIAFEEVLDWQAERGYLFYEYGCGGLAVGDVDGNGLPDLFCAGALEGNRLYMQEEPWRFVDATMTCGLRDEPAADRTTWSNGAALFDIDDDGDLDLYLCNYDTANQLFVNQGGGQFREEASRWGLDLVDASLMPCVCDFDRDGDLDIYLTVNRYFVKEGSFKVRDLVYRFDAQERLRPSVGKLFNLYRHPNKSSQIVLWVGGKDRLLQNNGPGKRFSDVSEKMQIGRADTLSATWWDYNHDGWPDLYVCNDFFTPDNLHRNNGDGTFTDVARDSLPHTPWSAMGSTAGDINNDGLVDLLAADMAFRTHYKDKVFMGSMSTKFMEIEHFPGVQLMRNALYVNTGTERFQEAAYAAGLANTEWTWTAKFADFDSDGRLDAYFTNGTPVSLAISPESLAYDPGTVNLSVWQPHVDQSPVREQNLAFRNVGGLEFEDVSSRWGLDHVGMSFAAVHADLDRDGDLDIVTANLDEPLSVYRNNGRPEANTILVSLRGQQSNRHGIGAEVQVRVGDDVQLRQIFPVDGFKACQEAVIHFGIGEAITVDELNVQWPSGHRQSFKNVAANKHHVIREPSHPAAIQDSEVTAAAMFERFEAFPAVRHHEEPFDDFAREPLLPNQLSQLGPVMAWGDLNRDGYADFYVGEGAGWMGMVYLGKPQGRFVASPQNALAEDAAAEDRAAAFLDVDQDGDLDLFVGSGSVECDPGDAVLLDRLYLNDGQGNLDRSVGHLPTLKLSTGAVAACDFDHDGDVDLFVGGRSIPGQYPAAPQHAVLVNEDGAQFINRSAIVGPELSAVGMVTDAVWADVNADGWEDLILACDWGPVQVFVNRDGRLERATAEAGLAELLGWWCCLAVADVDSDGDVDLLAGNFGRNTKYHPSAEKPVFIYYGNYDGSGKKHLIEAKYEGDTLLPMRGRSCSSAAMPFLKEKFPTYDLFARASLPDIYTSDCLADAQKFTATTLDTVCLLNDGSGRFDAIPLPFQAQLAPVFGIATLDANDDGIVDAYLSQNFFTPQKETGPMDGGVGLIALGNGDGTFKALRPDRAGIVVPGDGRGAQAVDLDQDGDDDLCVLTNNGPMLAFRRMGLDEGQRSPASAETAANPTEPFSSRFDPQHPQAVRDRLKAVPNDGAAAVAWAEHLRVKGRFADAQEVLKRVQTSASGQSVPSVAWVLARARLARDMKRFDEAVAELRLGRALKEGNEEIELLLAEILLAQGNLSEAKAVLTAMGTTPRGADLLGQLQEQATAARQLSARALKEQMEGSDADAVRLYRASIRADSSYPTSLNNLAWLLLTTEDGAVRDGELAVIFAKRAAKLTGFESPDQLDTLAQAYAGAGDYAAAVETCEQALQLEAVRQDPSLAGAFRDLLDGYLKEEVKE